MILFDDWIPRCFKALLMMMKPACTMISASFFHGEPGSEADHFGGGFEPFQRHIHHPSHCQVLGDSAALEGMLEEARSRMDPCGSSAVSQAEIGIRCPKNGKFCFTSIWSQTKRYRKLIWIHLILWIRILLFYLFGCYILKCFFTIKTRGYCNPWKLGFNRRKFGSQTSDNMERWKSSQQGEESEEKRSEERRCRCAKR